MNKGTVISVLIGLALIVGIFLGRSLINKLDDPHTRINNGEAYVSKYIAGCDTMRLTMKNFKDNDNFFKVKGTSNTSDYNTTGYINKHAIQFYADSLKKYFSVYFFFTNNTESDELFRTYVSVNLNEKNTPIVATVNKAELNDPSYGTKEKPVPILYFYGVKQGPDFLYTLMQENSKKFQGNSAEYKTFIQNFNVSHYLSYVKSKPDFNKMFGAGN